MARVFRVFTTDVEIVAAEWRRQVLTTDVWAVAGRPGDKGGESAGFFVRSGDRGGFAKPGRDDPPVAQCPRAAHEKIAADLAFELGLPVPPVVLWDRGSAPEGRERYVAISLLVFRNLHTWSQVEAEPSLAQRLAAAFSEAASAMSAFDTWVGNTDRQNPANLLAHLDDRSDPALTRVAYIDYAYSLSHSWNQGEAWKLPTAVAYYPSQGVLDVAAVGEAVSRIEELPEALIGEIVSRVPAGFLIPERSRVILEGLLHRQGALRAIMRATYPGVS